MELRVNIICSSLESGISVSILSLLSRRIQSFRHLYRRLFNKDPRYWETVQMKLLSAWTCFKKIYQTLLMNLFLNLPLDARTSHFTTLYSSLLPINDFQWGASCYLPKFWLLRGQDTLEPRTYKCRVVVAPFTSTGVTRPFV